MLTYLITEIGNTIILRRLAHLNIKIWNKCAEFQTKGNNIIHKLHSQDKSFKIEFEINNIEFTSEMTITYAYICVSNK